MVLQVSISVMILTIAVLSIERYVGICYPMLAYKHKSMSKSRAHKAIVTIWILSLVMYLPENLQLGVVHHVDDPTVVFCYSVNDSEVFVRLKTLKAFFFYLTPMILITTMYVLSGLELRKSAEEIKSNNDNSNNSKQQAPEVLSK